MQNLILGSRFATAQIVFYSLFPTAYSPSFNVPCDTDGRKEL